MSSGIETNSWRFLQQHYQCYNVMEMMTENPGSVRNSHTLMNAGANMPNLGTNSRNRPVLLFYPKPIEDAGSDSSPEQNNGYNF
ncbi:bombyxin B-2 [Trichonephila clavata]|uniref:Bombyxin B-2 n=1 Tax=Trichonephila clavata TaxID=2740835 RepID=A0A8X6F1Y7_TRICU|nr:bombyxin B-2 [Trichonephila clavata]